MEKILKGWCAKLLAVTGCSGEKKGLFKTQSRRESIEYSGRSIEEQVRICWGPAGRLPHSRQGDRRKGAF